MSSSCITRCSIIAIAFLSLANSASANFEITEIMYDVSGTDADREWVEVENTGASSEDLSKWSFFSANTRHALVPDTVSLVPAGGYAVLAQKASKFKIDWPNYTGILFDSSWTGLNNATDTIALKDPSSNLLSSFTYTSGMGASGDGNTLQKNNGTWASAAPTPGAALIGYADNPSTPPSSSASPNGSSSSSSSSSSSTSAVAASGAKKEDTTPKMITDIISKNTVMSHIGFTISSHTTGLSKEVLTHGKFIWNFGDGVSREETDAVPFIYMYEYPGDYVLTLSYSPNYYSIEPDATDRMIIKVLDEGVVISSVGDSIDPYVTLQNKSSYEVPLSNWIIKGVTHSFTIPEGTILLPLTTLKLSPRRTLLDSSDMRMVELENPSEEIISTYPATKHEVATISTPHVALSDTSYISPDSNPKNTVDTSIDLNALGASAADSKAPLSSSYAWFGLGGLIIIGAGATIFIRHPKRTSDPLEKVIRAEDMTIIE